MSPAAAEETLPLVRDSVRRVLTRSSAFRALPPDQRRNLAHDMVKVARYMIDAGGETAGVPMTARVATGLAGPDRAGEVRQIGENRQTASQRMGQSGAAAARSGGQALTDIINRVDFPRFVGGLVEGTFNAIVNASIKQMEAYSNLVANIAKSADEYMRDNITPNQARDFLASKYPEHLKVDPARGDPKLVPVRGGRGARGGRGGRGGGFAQGLADQPGAPSGLPDFMKDLGLPEPITRLDPKTAEDTLVPAARRRMAMDRQQLLATMVLMGINRLIVTDGKISASCLFELDTSDAIYEDTTTASSFDETVRKRQTTGWHFWFIPSEVQRTTSKFNVTTTNSSSSESTANLHAELSGHVDINFRSETFPLEKMADLLQIKEIEQKAPAAAAPAAPTGPPIQLPPPPALPALPGIPGAAQPAPAAPAPPAG
jgi:hypothetical protein